MNCKMYVSPLLAKLGKNSVFFDFYYAIIIDIVYSL